MNSSRFHCPGSFLSSDGLRLWSIVVWYQTGYVTRTVYRYLRCILATITHSPAAPHCWKLPTPTVSLILQSTTGKHNYIIENFRKSKTNIGYIFHICSQFGPQSRHRRDRGPTTGAKAEEMMPLGDIRRMGARNEDWETATWKPQRQGQTAWDNQADTQEK